ncbi:MAG: DUF4288 domain-containing protein [Flavisolibacter sp.]
MNWYLAKITYRIVCGDGRHTAQFDEQLRLIAADDEAEALDKARSIGYREEESFYNLKQQLVQWQFIDVPELHLLNVLIDGAELYSRITEVDDPENYIAWTHHKAQFLKENHGQQLTHII